MRLLKNYVALGESACPTSLRENRQDFGRTTLGTVLLD
jgi:hypothetical protein